MSKYREQQELRQKIQGLEQWILSQQELKTSGVIFIAYFSGHQQGVVTESSQAQIIREKFPMSTRAMNFLSSISAPPPPNEIFMANTNKNLEANIEEEEKSIYLDELDNIFDRLHEEDDRIAKNWEEIDRLGKKTRASMAELEELLG